MITGSQISIISLLASSVIVFWFATMAAIQTKKRWPFFPFFLQFSLVCFIAAGLFTGITNTLLDIFVYGISTIVGAVYLIALWRENHA